jgi:biopolymer transport protein ExbD
MRARRPKKTEWRSSFASMSDIAFLLIIFFAVAGKFTQSDKKELVLPAAEVGERTQKRDIELVVGEDAFLLNGEKVEADGLKDALASYIVAGAPKESKTVTLFADRDAEYGAVATAIDAINRADGYLEMAVKQDK